MLSAAERLCAFATLKKLLLHDVSDGISAVSVALLYMCVQTEYFVELNKVKPL